MKTISILPSSLGTAPRALPQWWNKPEKSVLRVAFVAIPYGDTAESVPPLGAMSVAAFAQQSLGSSVIVRIFDQSRATANREVDITALASFKPDVVGFSVYSSHVGEVGKWAMAVKGAFPDALVIAGGPHVTLTWHSFLERWSSVFDLCIRGDGELPFLALLRRLLSPPESRAFDWKGIGYRNCDNAVFISETEEPFDIEQSANPLLLRVKGASPALLFTDRVSKRTRPAIALVSSRSCPLKCSFCSIIAMPGKWRALSMDKLFDWLAETRRSKHFDHVFFLDANFFVVPNRVRAFAQRFQAEFPDVTWSASSTVGMLLKLSDDIATLKQSGLRLVEMGIEAGSQRQLDRLNKAASVKQNIDAIRLLQVNGIEIGLDFIMFYPDQTIEDLQANLDYLRTCDLTLHEGWEHLLNALQLYPGTPLRGSYQELRGETFDPDELPDTASLFSDPNVARIFKLFRNEFAPGYLPELDRLFESIRSARRALSPQSRCFQLLVLQEVWLKHLPLRVLHALIASDPHEFDLERAAPCLAAYRRWREPISLKPTTFSTDRAHKIIHA
jgi:radical SAM superfamily enzyme YgiQ (UPF0313 family)